MHHSCGEARARERKLNSDPLMWASGKNGQGECKWNRWCVCMRVCVCVCVCVCVSENPCACVGSLVFAVCGARALARSSCRASHPGQDLQWLWLPEVFMSS